MRSHLRVSASLLMSVATCLGLPAPRAATAGPPFNAGMPHTPQCRDGKCSPHCPVRPSHFGHYQTQWRQWPGSNLLTGSANPTAATPARPPRSVVPGPNEESAARLGDDGLPQPDKAAVGGAPAAAGDRQAAPILPQPAGNVPPAVPVQPAAPPKSTPPADDKLFDAGPRASGDSARLDRLAREAQLARAGSPTEQARFTEGLIAAILAEHDPVGRCGIVNLAAGFQTPAAEAICAGALEDPDSRVRITACAAWASRRGPRAVEVLGRRLEVDSDPAVRRRACAALATIRDDAALAVLQRSAGDADPEVRALVARAMAAGPAAPRWATSPGTTPPPAAPPAGRF